MLPSVAHTTAILVFERLLFSLTAGTALVLMISIAMRFLPRGNSQTRFAVWFSAMLATAVLPLSYLIPLPRLSVASPAAGHPLLTVPGYWAESIVLGWALLAGLGLLRVAFGLWQVRRMRQSSSKLDLEALGPQSRAILAKQWRGRPVSLLVSEELEVPTAIGFLHPAIILPSWLISDHAGAPSLESSDENLKYILLHELAHLRRWDDWTNLAQRLIKAILFFHPAVWWIERRLALDREMACDDAVIEETASPRAYALCLTKVAEKSFLRRQIELAQAAVSRVKQLSHRVAGIMDDRPRKTHIWKPAVPMVLAVAVLSAFSAHDSTELVGFGSGKFEAARSSRAAISDGADPVTNINPPPASWKVTRATMSIGSNTSPSPRKVKYERPRKPSLDRGTSGSMITRKEAVTGAKEFDDPILTRAGNGLEPSQPWVNDRARPAQLVLVIVTQGQVSANGASISSWELFFYLPAERKQVLSKT
jgi:beta-lactamase regulating signal transducer with metallopeptidase domain